MNIESITIFMPIIMTCVVVYVALKAIRKGIQHTLPAETELDESDSYEDDLTEVAAHSERSGEASFIKRTPAHPVRSSSGRGFKRVERVVTREEALEDVQGEVSTYFDSAADLRRAVITSEILKRKFK